MNSQGTADIIEEKRLSDRQCRVVLSMLADALVEIQLSNGRYQILYCSDQTWRQIPETGDYQEVFGQLLIDSVLPMEILPMQTTMSLDALRRSEAAGESGVSCRVTRNGAQQGSILCRVLFAQKDGEAVAILTIASDHVCGQVSAPGHQLFRDYDAALRNIYDELYELNITCNCYRIVYHVADKYVVPPEFGILDETMLLVANRMIFPEDRQRFLEFLDLERLQDVFASGRDSVTAEFRKLWVDGRFHWASLTVLPARGRPDGEQVYLCYIMDIDERKRADALAEQNVAHLQHHLDNERYRIIVEQTGTYVFEWSLDHKTQYLSPKLAETFSGDYDDRDLVRVWRDDEVVHRDDCKTFDQQIAAFKTGSRYVEMTIRLRTRRRGYVWCRMTLTKLVDEDDQLKRVIGTINDVDEAVHSEKMLKYRAEYDTLTGIYNVNAFYNYGRELLQQHRDQPYAVIRVDINRFKLINDVYGIEEGDKLLRFIAMRLQDNSGSRDIIGRLGGDVFCMLVAYRAESELIALAERLAEQIANYPLSSRVMPSLGICEVDDVQVPVSILCDWANLALKTVKGSTIKKWAFYDDTLRSRQLSERAIESEMDRALERREFCVYLQPKHDIGSGQVIGAEALVRWMHPREGLMVPGKFVPLFERNGFIVRLDEYVWEETCRLQRQWMDAGLAPVPISMNVSRTHIYDPAFCEKLVALVGRYRLPHALIELELTESTFIDNPEELYSAMETLRGKGFIFSMDDFGSGYSSLNMLKSAAVNTIKLDREFLNETAATEKGQTVIRYTIAMAQKLGLDVLAEGVETQDQASFLLQAGCTSAQGYYFSRPMPPDQFEKLVFCK